MVKNFHIRGFCKLKLPKSYQRYHMKSIARTISKMIYRLQRVRERDFSMIVETAARAPGTLRPGSPARCPGGGPAVGAGPVAAGAGSPSGSEESNSPTELNSCRRLTDKPPLVKRLALGLAGALAPGDDDATPLVTDTHSPSHCGVAGTGGGYVNESAGDAEVRTRRSNGELPRRGPRDLRVPLDNRQPWCGAQSSGGSSSSGSSSCGSAHVVRSPNNNAPRPEPELKRAPWFQAGIPREIALEVLGGQPVGTFLVRSSSSQADCYALSVRVPRDFQPTGIAHYLILRTPKGYKIKGFTKEFPSLSALVTHHSVMPELLPCPLLLARRAPRAPRRDDLADADCPALADFRRMMCELDV
ncbi:Tensin-3 [Eumeta japonica]|uniref:Tensin-3 n=1 Tax=Eumeta variegata TaxID=151549 RepID=A0A4C1Z8S4_EUMVA|nr:Tensin-3 [Eumeta japonica]